MKEKFVKFGIVLLVFLLSVGLALAVLSSYISVTGTALLSTNPNIVLWLPFNEGSGCTAYDISQYGNNGNLEPSCPDNNPVWVNGILGKALDFDGSDDYVEVLHSFSLNIGDGGITLEAWINTDAFPSGDRWQVIGKVDAYALQVSDNGKVRVWLGPLTTYVETDNVVLQSDEWYHIAGVYDGSTVKIYVNGNLEKEVSKTGDQATSTNNILIGARIPGGYFNGIIDNPRIWNIALTAEQILNIYQKGVG
jgi:hypothetical protein